MNTKELLGNLVNKKHVYFTESGNKAIWHMLKYAQTKRKEIVFQDQGGWLTYEQFCKRLRLEYHKLATDAGLIYPEDLHFHPNKVLLINSMPAYAYYENMEAIQEVCKHHNILIINDVSGSIGTEEANIGDIIVGSFGKAKPLGIQDGGFIATDDDTIISYLEDIEEYLPDQDKLADAMGWLQMRRQQWLLMNQKIKRDLEKHSIIHPEKEGFNVLVRFKSETEQKKIETYCTHNNLEFTICPRYIRVMESAVSIEVKRL